MEDLLKRAKRMAVIGAVLLWIVSPILIGGLITVLVRMQGRHVGALAYAGVLIWALAALVVLLVGFAYLLAGVFFWWRAHHPHTQVVRTASPTDREDRAQLLRELRTELSEGRRGARDTTKDSV